MVVGDGTTTVCGVCRRPGLPVVRYTITAEDGREGEVDRCADHAEPFETALTQADRRSTSRARRRTTVTTVEEINRTKASESAPAPQPQKSGSGSRKRRRTTVTTVEEINRSKEADKA